MKPFVGNKLMLVLLGALVLLNACVPSPTPEPLTDTLVVTVSIPPQAYFLQRIAGEHLTVNVMVGAGDDPHSYEPTPNQMRALEQSSIYFSVGVEFEDAWLDRFASVNPAMRIVDTARDVTRIPMEEEHDHAAGELDPHIWLSPRLVEAQAEVIADTLIDMDPDNEALYKEGLAALIADIDQLDQYIRSNLDGLVSRKVMTFHPAWNYFARDYNLEVIAVEVGGQEPGAADLKTIIDLAKANNISVIFAQSTFSSKSAQVLAAEINAKVVLLDPLAYDWLSNMQQVADAFAQ